MHTTAPQTEMCNTERNDWASQPDRQTDRHIHRRQTSRSRWSSYFRSEGIRLHVKETSFHERRDSIRQVYESHQQVALASCTLTTAQLEKTESLRAANFGYVKQLNQLSRIPNVHYSSHKSLSLNYILSRITMFRSTMDRIYDSGPIILYYNTIVLQLLTVTSCTGLQHRSNRLYHIDYVCSRLYYLDLCKYTVWRSHNDEIA